jgi:hypothetical protein
MTHDDFLDPPEWDPAPPPKTKEPDKAGGDQAAAPPTLSSAAASTQASDSFSAFKNVREQIPKLAAKEHRLFLPCVGRPAGGVGDELGGILAPLDVIFRTTGDEQVVEIYEEDWSGEYDRFKLARGGTKFRPLTPTRFQTWTEQFVTTGVKVQSQKDGQWHFQPTTMTERDARRFLQAPQFLKRLPRIARILTVPIPIRTPQGDIIFPKPGFNPELGIYCVPDLPPIRLCSLEEARAIIERLYSGFCWKFTQSRIHAIARLITPYLRGVMGFAARFPLWYYVGNRPRCGKDYCNGVAQIVYIGHAFEDIPLSENYEETWKRIVAALRSGRAMIHFANCQHFLGDPNFIQAITGPTINARNLGHNDATADLELPNEIDYSISVNIGVTEREDIAPRTRKIELAYYEEDANRRTFPDPFLHQWITNNRGEALSAIYSFCQAWLKAGAPAGTTLFNSFPQWARDAGGFMTFCELGDPCLPHEGEDLIGGDRRELAMKAVFKLLYELRPDKWLSKQEIFQLIAANSDDDERLAWCQGLESDNTTEKTSARTRVGMALSAYEKRVLCGIQLLVDNSLSESQRWQYRFTRAL